MKICAYSVRKEDEEHFLKTLAEELGIAIRLTSHPPELSTAVMAEGSTCISIMAPPMRGASFNKFRLGWRDKPQCKPF